MSNQYKWTQRSPATTPPGRRDGGACYFPHQTAVVIAGGTGNAGARHDAYRWGGVNWLTDGTWSTDLFDFNSVAYHAGTDTLVALTATGHTWVYDGITWTQVFPATSPGPNFIAGQGKYMGGSINKTIFCGGTYPPGCTGKSFETWSWDGTTWAQIVTTHHPTTRGAFFLSTDGVSDNLYLFGGIDDCGTFTYNAETWVFDGADWTQLTPAHSPSARSSPAFCYIPDLNVHLLHGGEQPPGEATLGDDWVWDETDWTQVTPCVAMTGNRSRAMMDWDPSRGLGILFGGIVVAGEIPESVTWQLEAAIDPAITTDPATDNVCSTALLNATVTPNGDADVFFDYGPTIAYGSSVSAGVVSGSSPTAVSATISGLTAGTTYHFRARARAYLFCGGVTGADETFVEGDCEGNPTLNASFAL